MKIATFLLFAALAAISIVPAAPLAGPLPRAGCVLYEADDWVEIAPGETLFYGFDLSGCTPDELGDAVFYGHINPNATNRQTAKTIRGNDDIALEVRGPAGTVYVSPSTGPGDEIRVPAPTTVGVYVGRVTNSGNQSARLRVTWIVPSYFGI